MAAVSSCLPAEQCVMSLSLSSPGSFLAVCTSGMGIFCQSPGELGSNECLEELGRSRGPLQEQLCEIWIVFLPLVPSRNQRCCAVTESSRPSSLVCQGREQLWELWGWPQPPCQCWGLGKRDLKKDDISPFHFPSSQPLRL